MIGFAVLTGAGTYLCARVGYGLAIQPDGVSVVWPGSGFVLAMLILGERRWWPAILAGAALGGAFADLQHGGTAAFAVAAALANVGESLVAAWVVTRVAGPRVALATLREVVTLVGGAVIASNGVTALAGALVLAHGGGIPFGRAWIVWWTGDGMGMLLVTPVILTWTHGVRTRRRLSRGATIEAAGVLAATAIIGYFVLSDGAETSRDPYLVFPLLLWMAARFGPWGATTATLVLSVVAEVAAAHGTGIFGNAGAPAIDRVHAIYSYLALASVSSLIPASILSERWQVEAELRRSERRFRQMAEHILEAFFTVDLKTGRPLYVSPTWSEIWGRPLAEGYDARVWFEAIHPDDRAAMQASQAAVLRGEASTTVFRVIRPDGSVRWVRGRAFPVRDQSGAVYRLVGISEDVTAEREMETALRRSHDLLNQTAQLARVGGWQLDVDPQRLYWSDEVRQIHEVAPSAQPSVDEAIQFYAPEARPIISAAVAAALEAGTPFDLELPVITATGRHIWVRAIGEVDRANGHTVRLHGVVQDITERRHADDLHRLQSAALEATADGIVITDRGGTIEWVNPAFTRLTGYAADEAIGKNPRDLVRSGQHDEPFYERLWETIVSGRTWQGETINRRKDGTLYTEDQAITPILDASGAITHFVSVKTDITERQKLQAQLHQSQKMETVGQLASGIAHDFNNLLTVINGVSELIIADLGGDDPIYADVQEILRAGQRAAQLTRQLLAFSRQQLLQLEVVNLNTVIEGSEPLLRRLLDEDIDLVVDAAADLGNTLVDPGQMEQVIVNLVVNARDAMPQGGRLILQTRNVELDDTSTPHGGATVPPGPYVQLTVSDTGIGMDDATRSRIFDPFFTTKPKGQGTGLGLSTVYGIVKQSQGFVWVYSEPGQGTNFRIYLPRVEDAAGTHPESPRTNRSATGHETILVVDDSAEVRTLVKRLLESGGYTVLTASSGAEALHVIDRHPEPVGLVLTDVVMSDMGGRELAAQLAREHGAPRVMYMSGHTDDTVLRHGISHADVPFIGKPFTKQSLLQKVREVFDSWTQGPIAGP